MSTDTAPCLFGEVLLDHFPDGRRVLGGAPFNVAWHLQAFGEAPRLVSRVGDDAAGAAVRRAMDDWSMDGSALQGDTDLPTGRVQVRIENDEPAYEIVHPAAWDRIDGESLPAGGCGLLYHGSLALRDPVSRAALENLRAAATATVFLDVNLRPPWYQPARVIEWLRAAHWAKLNEDEFRELAELMALPGADASLAVRAEGFRECLGLDALVVTRGGRGALLSARGGETLTEPAASAGAPLVDTVGAGDAFSSVLILGLLRDWAPERSLARALEFAAAVCGQRGATVAEHGFYAHFRRAWGIDEADPGHV